MTTKDLFARIGAAALAMAFAGGLCEVGARMMFPAPPNGAREPQIGYRYDPEIRYVLAPNQAGWIDDGFVTVNSLGFRGPELVSPKPKGRFRIVVLGDSVTLGWGVGDQETFEAQLERLLRDKFRDREIDVVNLGVSGYDTRQEVTLLKRNLARLEPDLVLVGFYSNDVPDAATDEGQSGGSESPVVSDKTDPTRLLHINPAPTSWWNRQLRKSRAIYVAGRALTRFRGKGEWGLAHFTMELDMLKGTPSPDIDRAWGKIAMQFDQLHALSLLGKFSAGVLVLPCREQVMGEYPNAQYETKILAIAEPRGLFVIDPLPSLAKAPIKKDQLFIPYDRNHPSATGHGLIAHAILDYLDVHGIVTR